MHYLDSILEQEIVLWNPMSDRCEGAHEKKPITNPSHDDRDEGVPSPGLSYTDQGDT